MKHFLSSTLFLTSILFFSAQASAQKLTCDQRLEAKTVLVRTLEAQGWDASRDALIESFQEDELEKLMLETKNIGFRARLIDTIEVDLVKREHGLRINARHQILADIRADSDLIKSQAQQGQPAQIIFSIWPYRLLQQLGPSSYPSEQKLDQKALKEAAEHYQDFQLRLVLWTAERLQAKLEKRDLNTAPLYTEENSAFLQDLKSEIKDARRFELFLTSSGPYLDRFDILRIQQEVERVVETEEIRGTTLASVLLGTSYYLKLGVVGATQYSDETQYTDTESCQIFSKQVLELIRDKLDAINEYYRFSRTFDNNPDESEAGLFEENLLERIQVLAWIGGEEDLKRLIELDQYSRQKGLTEKEENSFSTLKAALKNSIQELENRFPESEFRSAPPNNH